MSPYDEHTAIVHHYPRTESTPAEISVACTCGEWGFESQESAGGGLESWGAYFEDHLVGVQLGGAA